MFDQVHFKINIEFDDEPAELADRNNLQRCTEGDNVYYQNTNVANFNGVFITIKNGKITVKCSLHKQFYKTEFGTLDNSKQFTISNALYTVNALFDTLGISRERVKATYFEVGLNIPTTADPLKYIEIMQSVGAGNERELFNDANYRKDRQRTTAKHKDKRKYLKVYDKGFEMANRKRTASTENILRIESVYKHQSKSLEVLFSPDNIERITKQFYKDWANVEFTRTVTTSKGVRPSQREKAVILLRLGRDGYLQKAETDRKAGIISRMELRTIREFVENWDSVKHLYKAEPSIYEVEYKKRLKELFNIVKY